MLSKNNIKITSSIADNAHRSLFYEAIEVWAENECERNVTNLKFQRKSTSLQCSSSIYFYHVSKTCTLHRELTPKTR